MPVGAARQRHHGAQRGGPLTHLHLELRRRNSASQQPGAARADPGSPRRGDAPGEIHPGEPHPARSTWGVPPGEIRPGRSTWGDPAWEIHPGSPPPTEPHPGRSRAAESAIWSRWAGPSGSTAVALLTWQRPFFAHWQQRIDFPGGNFPRLSSTHVVTVGGPHYGFWGGQGPESGQ